MSALTEIRAKSRPVGEAKQAIDYLSQLSLTLHDKSKNIAELDSAQLLDLQNKFDLLAKKLGIKTKTDSAFNANSISADKFSSVSKILNKLSVELAEVTEIYIDDGTHGRHNSHHVEDLAKAFSQIGEVAASLGRDIPKNVELNNWLNEIIGYQEAMTDVWNTQSATPVSYRARTQDVLNLFKELRKDFSSEKLQKIGALLDVETPNNIVVDDEQLNEIKAILKKVALDDKLAHLTDGNSINSAFATLEASFKEILRIADNKVVEIATTAKQDAQTVAPVTQIMVATEGDYHHEAGIVGIDHEDLDIMHHKKTIAR